MRRLSFCIYVSGTVKNQFSRICTFHEVLPRFTAVLRVAAVSLASLGLCVYFAEILTLSPIRTKVIDFKDILGFLLTI